MAGYTAVGPGLPPLCDAARGAGVLILGSFPSPKSREQAFYYGHPRNRFWPLMAALAHRPVPAWDDLEAKRALIVERGLAVWDVVYSCRIRGAADATIRDVVPNDIAALVRQLGVRRVVCNGATAARLYARWAQPATGLPALTLPSTSPANAAWSLARLQNAWGPALAPPGGGV